METPQNLNYRNIIERELNYRREKNKNYSLRAFARDLKLSPSSLSEILNGKSGLSLGKANSISKLLGLDIQEAKVFQDLVQMCHSRDPRSRIAAELRVNEYIENPVWQIEADRFEMISDWQYLATLELANLPENNCTCEEVAKRFLVTRTEAQKILNRLVRLGFLKLNGNIYDPVRISTKIESAVPSKAIRHYHRQMLTEGIESIESQTIDQRILNSTVMSVSEEQIPEAKVLIQQFASEFSKKLKTKKKNKKIYSLAIQFFRLEKGVSK